MAETALSRTARALDLIPYILEHPGISLDELATAFATSKEQLVSDLNLLFVCGLPGYTPLELIDLAFEDEIVSVIDPQVLDHPRTFTRGEVVALQLALNTLADFPALSKEMQGAVLSISKRLHDLLPTQISDLAARLAVTNDGLPENWIATISTISQALQRGRWLRFNYLSATDEKPSSRSIIPQSLTRKGEWYYLEAYLPEIKEMRTFRIDRISELTSVEPSEEWRATEPSLPAAIDPYQARLIVTPPAIAFLEENSAIVTDRRDNDRGAEVVVEIFDLEWLIREVLAFGGALVLLEPQSAATEVSKRAAEILTNYR